MANYRDAHNFSRSSIDTGSSKGLLWVFLAIAGLAALVLIGSLGGGPATVEHPGGAGAEPIAVTPAEPESATSSTSATSGTLVE